MRIPIDLLEATEADRAAQDPASTRSEAIHALLREAVVRRDLAWRLGLDEQVTDEGNRQIEIANFIEALSIPVRDVRR